MNFMEILNDLIDKSDDEVLSYFKQKNEELSFIDEFFRNFLVFLGEQKEAMREYNPQVVERIDKIIEILMIFAGARLRSSDIDALLFQESQKSFNAEDKRAEMIRKLETRSFEAIELKNQALAAKDPMLMEKAETIHLENIKQWEEMNLSNPEFLIKDIYQLALIYKHQQRFRESEDLLNRVIGHSAGMGNDEQVFQHKIELGKMYFQAKEPAKASQVLEECREYFEAPGKEVDEYALYFIYTTLAMTKFIFNERGDERPMREGLTYLVKASLFELVETHERYIRSVVSGLEFYKEYTNYNEVLENVLTGMEVTGAQLSLRLNGYELYT
jgi:tetratricopeptide (TPR) repeat protein